MGAKRGGGVRAFFVQAFALMLALLISFALLAPSAAYAVLDNFDTGSVTGPGQYWLNDVTQAQLLDALAKQNFSGASPELRAELLEFFADPNAPYAIKGKKKEWARVQAEIAQLRQETPRTVAADARKLLNSNSMEVPF